MENLRLFLYQYPTEAPVYFGCKFRRYIRQGYMSGGAGYVLSKKALMMFSTEAFNNARVCPYSITPEDKKLGTCLQSIGVIAGDSRDAEGLERFVPLPPGYVVPTETVDWYVQYVYHAADKNVTCCSPNAISFHYIEPDHLYVLEYLLYTLRPFGAIDNITEYLPEKISTSEFLEGFLGSIYPLSAPPTVAEAINGNYSNIN